MLGRKAPEDLTAILLIQGCLYCRPYFIARLLVNLGIDFVASGSGTQSLQVLVFPGRSVASPSGISQGPTWLAVVLEDELDHFLLVAEVSGRPHTDQLTKVTTHVPVRFRSIHRWLPKACLQVESSADEKVGR